MSADSNANLIRRFVDGELTAAEKAEFQRALEADPDLRSRVEFEQHLRRHISRTMLSAAPAAPPDLAARIQSAWETAEPVDIPDTAPARPETAPARQTQSASNEPTAAGEVGVLARLIGWTRAPRPVSPFAVAACLILIAGVVAWSIFAPQIDDRADQPAYTDMASDAAQFAYEEHERCVTDETHVHNKLRINCKRQAVSDLSTHLGVDDITVFDFSDVGYTFIGEGHCGLPGPAPSAHLIYRRDVPGKPSTLASVFITPNLGQFDDAGTMEPGNWYEVSCKKTCSGIVLGSTDSALIYFLVCCDAEDRDALAAAIDRGLALSSP